MQSRLMLPPVWCHAEFQRKGLNSSKELRAMILRGGEELSNLYRALLEPSLEVGVMGKGRNAARWRRVNAESTWPEVARQGSVGPH